VRSDAGATSDRLPDFNLDYMQYEAQADRPKQYAAGRRCCHDGCKTILSRYNGGTMCDLHKSAQDFMVFTDTIIFGEKTCGRCGAVKPRNSEHFRSDDSSPDGMRFCCGSCDSTSKHAARARESAHARERYANDPEYRERRKTETRERKRRQYADPEYRAKVLAKQRARRMAKKIERTA